MYKSSRSFGVEPITLYADNLIELVVSWEERGEGKYLKNHAADTPHVHFVGVISIGH